VSDGTVSDGTVSDGAVGEVTVAVTVNGDRLLVPAGTTIADVVARLIEGAEPKGIAVAVDRCVIPRSEWATTRVDAELPIEIVTAAAGG
jgi:sulfur carrier protein